MTERELLDRIHQAHPDAALFRNDNGYAVMGGDVKKNDDGTADVIGGRWRPYGLQPGSADLVGWTPVLVTPDMVGKTVAVFTSLEAKTENDTVKADQVNWARQVREDGGIAKIIRAQIDSGLIEEPFWEWENM